MAKIDDVEGRAASNQDTSDRRTRRDRLLARLLRLDRESVEPTPVDVARYREVNETFVDAVFPHSSVHSIYGDSKTPTVPGISDADFTVVVDDEPEDVTGLVGTVRSVLDRFPEVCTHGVGILPESVAEYYPLFDCFTLALDHLAGDPITPAVEENEATTALILFDNLSSRAFRYLLNGVLPRPSVPSRQRGPVSLAVKFLNPIASVKRGVPSLALDRLVLAKRDGLHAMSSPKHDLGYFERALGRTPDDQHDAVDRAREFRSTYFETEPSDSQYLDMMFDLLEFEFQLMQDFVAEQDVYDASDDTFFIRRGEPTIATPTFDDLSIYDVVDRSLDSATTIIVLPPEVARHLATLPHAERLIFGTPPEPRVQRPEVARLLNLRREVFSDLLAFKRESGIATAMPDTFCFPHIAGFVGNNVPVGERGVAGIVPATKRRLRDVRNRTVLRAWDERSPEN